MLFLKLEIIVLRIVKRKIHSNGRKGDIVMRQFRKSSMKKSFLSNAILGFSALVLVASHTIQGAVAQTATSDATAQIGGKFPPRWGDYEVSTLDSFAELLALQDSLTNSKGPCSSGFSRTSPSLGSSGFPATLQILEQMVVFYNSYNVEKSDGMSCADNEWTLTRRVYTNDAHNSVCLEALNVMRTAPATPGSCQVAECRNPGAPECQAAGCCTQAQASFWACCDA